jgi:predicted HicB family RNase H-like nuclease
MRKSPILKEKSFNLRLSKELWSFMKKNSVDHETSINQLITDLLNNYKKRCENSLTGKDVMI